MHVWKSMMKWNHYTYKQMYFGVGLGTTLLQTRSNNSCSRDEAPDNSILRHIAFTSKGLTRAEKRYRNIERERLGTLYGLEKIPPLLLCERSEYNYRSQTIGCNIWRRCSNIVTETTKNPAKSTLIQDENHIKTWTRSFHSRLAIGKKITVKDEDEHKDGEIPGMQLSVIAIQMATNILECMTIHEL